MSVEEPEIASRQKSRNWLRGAMALRLVKTGMQKFIKAQIHQQYQDMLNTLTGSGAYLATGCNSCTAENLLPNHAIYPQKPCIQKNSRCCFCKNKSFSRRPCPKNLCGRLYDEIVKSHSKNSPLWINTNPSKWFEEEWEIAKCFLSSQGCADVHSAEDTDMTGLISIAINNTFIHNNMDTKIEDIIEIREIRNSIMHSASHELDDRQVHGYICKMIAFLEDERAFHEFEDAKQARAKLKELADESQYLITITEELDLEEEASNLATIILQQKDILQQLEKYAASQEPVELSGDTVTDLQDPKLNELQELPEFISEANINTTTDRQELEETTLNEHKMPESDSNNMDSNSLSSSGVEMRPRSYVCDEMRKTCRRNILYMQETMGELLRQQEFDRQQKAMIDNNNRKCIQENLIAYYKKSYSSTDVVPSLSERQIHIDKMYVAPLLLLKPLAEDTDEYFYEHSYYNTTQSKQAKVRYKEISFDGFLYNENMFNKTILISGEAGVGKTSFCLKFLSEWCDFVTTTLPNRKKLTPTSLTNKDYVFYIPLKHCPDCVSIEEMIRRQLVNEMYHTTLMEILQSESERCLVILDGLDSWSPPKLACSDVINEGLPNRELVSQLTLIYTTRPWKLATVRPKSNNFDVCMELRGIVDTAVEAGVDRILDNLNCMLCSRKSSKSSKDFIKFLKKRNLFNLTTNPLLLKSVVALWFDGKVGDMSYSGIYTFIVDTLLDRIKQTVDHCAKSLYFIKLQNRFADNSNFCRFIEAYILPLAKFSFHLCCKKNKRFCFMFQDFNLENFGLDKNTLETLLKCGILCERAVYNQSATRKCTELSFIDDTFIDYFSAVYLSLFPEMFSNLSLTYEMLLDKKLVFQFLSGIGNVSVLTISERISFLVNSYKDVMKYRDGTSMFPGFIIEIQQLIFDCVLEYENMSSLQIGDLFLADNVVPSFDFLHHINVSGVRSLYIDCFIPKYIFQRILAHVRTIELLVIRNRERNSVDPPMLETYLNNNNCTLKCLVLSGIDFTEIALFKKFISLKRLKIENSRLTIKQGTNLIMCSLCLEEVVFEKVFFIKNQTDVKASQQSIVSNTSIISKSGERGTIKCTGVSVSSKMAVLTISRCSFQNVDLINLLKTVSKSNPCMRVCLTLIYVEVVDDADTEQVLDQLKKIYDDINPQDVSFFRKTRQSQMSSKQWNRK